MATVASITRELEVPYCHGIRKGFRCHEDHDLNGSVVDGVIHVRDRTVTRQNIASVLKLVARARDPTLADDVPWRRVYRISVVVRALAAQLHYRIPRESFAADRSFVLASVAGLPNNVPLRKQAFDWARR